MLYYYPIIVFAWEGNFAPFREKQMTYFQDIPPHIQKI